MKLDEMPRIPIIFTGEERKVILYHDNSPEAQELVARLSSRYDVVSDVNGHKEPVAMRGLNSYQGEKNIRVSLLDGF